MNLAEEDLCMCVFTHVCLNQHLLLWHMNPCSLFLPIFLHYVNVKKSAKAVGIFYMSCVHITKTTVHQEPNPAVLLWSHQRISSQLNVDLVKAYHLHVSLKKMNLRRPHSAASNGCGTLSLFASAFHCSVLCCCAARFGTYRFCVGRSAAVMQR